MPGIVYTHTDVRRQNIKGFFLRGGQAERWMDRLRKNMHRLAVAEAPVRSGGLKAAHRSTTRGYNQYRTEVTVRNVSDHASYVHGGVPYGSKTRTADAIHGNPWLYVPAWGGYAAFRARSVSGQAANPWLDRACARVAGSEGAVRIG